MAVTKKTFFVQFSHFFSGQAIGMLLGLITFPILTRLLSVEQYGILSLVTNTVAIAVVFAKAGLSDGIIRFHEDYKGDNQQKLLFSSTILVIGLLLSVLVTLCYIISLPWLYKYLHIDKQFQFCFLVMALYLVVRPLSITFLNLLRMHERTILFNALNLANRFVSVIVGLFLLLYLIRELYGYFIGIVIAEYFLFFILIYWFLYNYKVSFSSVSIKLSKQLISFGVPLLLTELAYMLLTYADRYMILFFHGEQELGLYSVGYNLAMYIAQIVTFSISYAIVPLYVKIYTNNGKYETEKFLQDCLYYLLIIIIPVCFGYAAVGKELFIILATDKYADASSFSSIILVSSVIFGMNSLLNAGLYLHKKSFLILCVISIGVIVNIICNLLLLPKFHVMGAAISTLIACIATLVPTMILSFRFIIVRLKKDIMFHFLLSVFMYGCLMYISTSSVYLVLILKLSLGTLIVCAGIFYKERILIDQIRTKLFS